MMLSRLTHPILNPAPSMRRRPRNRIGSMVNPTYEHQTARPDKTGLPVPRSDSASYRRYIGALDMACAAGARFDPRQVRAASLSSASTARGAERVRVAVAAMACLVPRGAHAVRARREPRRARLLRGARGARVAARVVPAALRRVLRVHVREPARRDRVAAATAFFLRNPVVLTNRHLTRIRSALITRAAAPNH